MKRKQKERNEQYIVEESLALFLEHVNFILKKRFKKSQLKGGLMKKITDITYKVDKYKSPKIIRNKESEEFEELMNMDLDKAFQELNEFLEYD